jgi:hypothetical protein
MGDAQKLAQFLVLFGAVLASVVGVEDEIRKVQVASG